jgi:hypothetical protein
MDENIESNKSKTTFRQTTSAIGGKKNKKRPFSYLFLFIGSILILHVSFLWSQQQLIDPNSYEVRRSPGSVDKSFDLSESKTQTEKMELNETSIGNEKEDKAKDKRKIIEILEASGINVTDDIYARLPSWAVIQSMYGPSPVIHGLDTCSNFQRIIPKDEAYIGPAGTFNTGTNLLADLLPKYCTIDSPVGRSGMLWQVPWGKHNPISWRYRNIAIGMIFSLHPSIYPTHSLLHCCDYHYIIAGGKNVKDQGTVLPVVTIKGKRIRNKAQYPYFLLISHFI